MNRQRRQRRRFAGRERVVERGELLGDHAERPAVGNHLMHGDKQEVLVLGQPDDAGADQRAAREIEGMHELGLDEPVRGSFLF